MPRHPARRALVLLGAGGFIAAVVRGFEPVKVTGRSMLPTLRPGDLLAVSPAPAVVGRGDVVVATVDGVEVIKRAVAVAGDRYRGLPVPDGHVFLAGDNAAASTDSRFYGTVALAAVTGVARIVYWPPRRWRVL